MIRKLTKIVATLGPSCQKPEQIKKLILSGVNVFRFNTKHNDLTWHEEKIKTVRKIARDLNANIGIMIDLQGPEIRIKLKENEYSFFAGQLIPFGKDVFVSHPEIVRHIPDGQKVLIDDGSLSFKAVKRDGDLFLVSQANGTIRDRKNFNIPGCVIPVESLVKRDVEAIKMAGKTGVDFIALSFVRKTRDVENLKTIMKKNNVEADVIAKIETEESLENLEKIADKVDGLMVARGDLGVEISLEKVPYFQKKIIKQAFQKGIPVITATQMLQSMVDKPYPTRAEISDVANAFYDSTDALMLSAETATGKYPLKAVEMMANTLVFNENQNFLKDRKPYHFEIRNSADLITESAYRLYLSCQKNNKNLAGFLVFTQTGWTARSFSRYRPLLPVYVFAADLKVAGKLSIDFGVSAFIHEAAKNKEVTRNEIEKAVETLKRKKLIERKQLLIVLHGDYWAVKGGTSTVKMIEVK